MKEKKGWISGYDDVLYPEKDYLLQVYYLFAQFLEYTAAFPPAADLTDFLKKAYTHHGTERLFDRAAEHFGIDPVYKENFDRLHRSAQLPLKLLLFQEALKVLQQAASGGKQLILLVHGDPAEKLNRIRQTEWHGLDKRIKVYFSQELFAAGHNGPLQFILQDNRLLPEEVLFIGRSGTDSDAAKRAGVDYLDLDDCR
jgi:phosphoglycolate phosphatase-like HAD superfamily hydrolase